MATQKPRRSRLSDKPSFPVVVKRTLGTVESSLEGGDTPFEAAFKMIGGSGEEGDFEFTVPGDMLAGEDVTANLSVEFTSASKTKHLESLKGDTAREWD